MKKVILLTAMASVAAVLFGCQSKMTEVPNSFVPDATSAIKLAEIYLEPIYGRPTISSQLPLTATLDDSVWTVRGTVNSGIIGEQIVLEMNRENGAVRSVRPVVDFSRKAAPSTPEVRKY